MAPSVTEGAICVSRPRPDTSSKCLVLYQRYLVHRIPRIFTDAGPRQTTMAGTAPVLRPRPPSSIYSDDLPMMLDLIRRVSTDLWEQEAQAAAYYTGEIQALEDELALHRMVWNESIRVANEVIRTITAIRNHVTKVATAETRAGKEWVAFWDVYQKCIGSNPPYI
jgi:hypothetical protein